MDAERGNTKKRSVTMSDPHMLSDLFTATEPSTVVYIDGPGALPQVEEEALQDTVIARLEDCGAPAADVAVIKQALPARDGTPSPSVRYLLARQGRIEVDKTSPGARLGPERISSGPVPEIVPLVRQLARSVRYLIIEAGREGAEVRLERADRHAPEQVEEIEGRMDSLTKVQAGGLSHARYQRSAEEVWKRNQSEVAEVVDRLTEEQRPDFIVLAGDVRARQMLKSRLGEAASQLVIEYDTHTRAEGADDEGLERAVAEAAEQCIRNEIDTAVDRARTDDGRFGAEGVSAVVQALQQARVDTLVLDARLSDDEQRVLRALDAPPWVAESDPEGLDAVTIAEIPVAEALVRAAILTGARVLVREEEFVSPGEPRTDIDAPDPIAALRWEDEAT